MASIFQTERERVGLRIKLARTRAKLSHDELGRRVGTSRQHLIKLEKGQHAPRPEMLAAIARETGQELEFFLNATAEAEVEEEAAPIDEALQAMFDRAVDRAFEKRERLRSPGLLVSESGES